MAKGFRFRLPCRLSFTGVLNFGMMKEVQDKIISDRLNTFFLKLTQKSFGELGIHDTTVAGYVADLLTDFARVDHLYGVTARPVKKLESVVDILAEPGQETTPNEVRGEPNLMKERELRKYLGDYTLFMSGMFRSNVEHRGFLDYYIEEGSRSYLTVSELDLSLYRTGFLLYQELSEKFEYYSGALDYMRKAYFAAEPGKEPFAGFLKQIEGWMKVNISEN